MRSYGRFSFLAKDFRNKRLDIFHIVLVIGKMKTKSDDIRRETLSRSQ